MHGSDYWPAWLAAPVLAALTVGYWLVLRRPLGVSGMLERIVVTGAERQAELRAAELDRREAEIEAALMAATREAFGPAFAVDAPPGGDATPARRGRALAPAPPLLGHALFLAGLSAGGLLARLARGAPLDPTLGPDFARIVGGGGSALAALVAGGFLLGCGASLAGGCTAGHGLSGCSRLQPGSLVAGACFMAAAASASLALGWGR
jgi:hypothetical protein